MNIHYQISNVNCPESLYISNRYKTDKIIHKYRRQHLRRSLSLDDILDEVCKYYKISKMEIVGLCRKHEKVVARYAYSYLAKKLTNNGIVPIGRMINRHHASTLYYVKQIEGWISINDCSEVVNDVEVLRNILIRKYSIA
jgi:chromosomal replication initiation ATPase DnaA